MTIETPLPGAEDARPQRPPGFPPGSTVDVRQVDDQDWQNSAGTDLPRDKRRFRGAGAGADRLRICAPCVRVVHPPLRPLYQGRHPARLPVQRRCPRWPHRPDRRRRHLPAGHAGTRRPLPAPLDHVGRRQAGRPDQSRRAQEVVDRSLACRTGSSRRPADRRSHRRRDRDHASGLLPRRAAGLDPAQGGSQDPGKPAPPAKKVNRPTLRWKL